MGGGIIGLTAARDLLQKKIGRVTLLEKENALGRHASGRNSGVIHAGIYYKPGSLKARLCVEGARLLTSYALENKLPYSRMGKVIVATNEREAREIDRLHQQALQNGVKVELLDEKRLMDAEPNTRTYQKALFSPDTAIIDSHAVLDRLQKEIGDMGGRICLSSKAIRFDDDRGCLHTQNGTISYGRLVNAGGLQADQIAHACGVASEYSLMPVKGSYRYLSKTAADGFHHLVYPVPDPAMPFLGVHVTKYLSGEAVVGPTAFPVFGRENYSGISGIRLSEWPSIASDLILMTARNTNHIRSLVRQEASRWSLKGFIKELQKVAPKLTLSDLGGWARSGIRAQLIHKKTKKFDMDFVVRQGRRSIHILNAVSPAFTSSFAFAEMITELVAGHKNALVEI